MENTDNLLLVLVMMILVIVYLYASNPKEFGPQPCAFDTNQIKSMSLGSQLNGGGSLGGAFGFIVGSVSINEKIYYYTYLTQSDGSYIIQKDNSEDVSIYEDTDKNPYRKEQTGGPYGKCGPRIQYHVPNGTIVVNMQADITKIK